MSSLARREAILVITGVVVLIQLVDYFFVFKEVAPIAASITTWAVIISAIALGLGGFNILRIHTRWVVRRQKGRWFFSAWLIFVFVLLTLVGLTNISNPSANIIYGWSFRNVYTSLGQAFYAITGFYIFSAAYRAFRARNIDAALLLIAGIFVLLTNAPIGELIWGQIPVMGRWMVDFGQIPMSQTFLMMAAFGLLAYGFRVMLGRERGLYGEAGKE